MDTPLSGHDSTALIVALFNGLAVLGYIVSRIASSVLKAVRPGRDTGERILGVLDRILDRLDAQQATLDAMHRRIDAALSPAYRRGNGAEDRAG